MRIIIELEAGTKKETVQRFTNIIKDSLKNGLKSEEEQNCLKSITTQKEEGRSKGELDRFTDDCLKALRVSKDTLILIEQFKDATEYKSSLVIGEIYRAVQAKKYLEEKNDRQQKQIQELTILNLPF